MTFRALAFWAALLTAPALSAAPGGSAPMTGGRSAIAGRSAIGGSHSYGGGIARGGGVARGGSSGGTPEYGRRRFVPGVALVNSTEQSHAPFISLIVLLFLLGSGVAVLISDSQLHSA